MIRIVLGNLGAGKTINAVREIVEDDSGMPIFTNIAVKGINNVYRINPSDVIKKEKDEKGKTKYSLNIDFWIDQPKPLAIYWDEVHLSAGNSRSSMSHANKILSRFIAMGRRIVGMSEETGLNGYMVYIAQSERTLDVNLRDLCNEIYYLVGMWVINCTECGQKLARNSDQKQLRRCIFCDSGKITITDHKTLIYEFSTWEGYIKFRMGMSGKHYSQPPKVIEDLKRYFKYYDTLQIADLWNDYLDD